MYYTVYKVINEVNKKVYIGKHQTKDLDDGYMGSGKLIKRSISKRGIENFRKEILFVFNSEQEMNAKEAELVTEEFCCQKDNYNLCNGGQGGFSHIRRDRKKHVEYTRKGRLAANKAIQLKYGVVHISEQQHRDCLEKYFKSPSLCLHCNKEIEYTKRKNKFCNSSCAASYTNPRRVLKRNKN